MGSGVPGLGVTQRRRESVPGLEVVGGPQYRISVVPPGSTVSSGSSGSSSGGTNISGDPAVDPGVQKLSFLPLETPPLFTAHLRVWR